jgi:hypothetical protein
MMDRSSHRILAVDVRPRKIGFVTLDQSGRMLDAATRKMKSVVVGETRFTWLIDTFRPSVIVLRKIRVTTTRYRPRTMVLQRLIARLAHHRGIPVAFVGEEELRAYFSIRRAGTKHEVATLLAKRFHELAWKLPEKRKIYDQEHWSMVVFDAAALGVSFLAREENKCTCG